jgi:Ca2+-dependent lipid-binding protein
MISAFDLVPKDNGSHSDPYLYLKLGDRVYNERDHFQQDEPNPGFYKHFDFEATFPGCPPLVIKIFDYDTIFGDDLIGTTIIDLEDRFFSPEWQSIKNKPIEYR